MPENLADNTGSIAQSSPIAELASIVGPDIKHKTNPAVHNALKRQGFFSNDKARARSYHQAISLSRHDYQLSMNRFISTFHENESFTCTSTDMGKLKLIIDSIATCLHTVTFLNKQFPREITVYKTQHLPPISLNDYLNRLAEYWPRCMKDTNIEALFIMTTIYIDRFQAHKNRGPGPLEMHRLFLGCFYLASQMLDDGWRNSEKMSRVYLSKLGGVSEHDLQKIQLDLVADVNFDLYISNETYMLYKESLFKQLGLPLQESNLAGRTHT